MRITHCYVPPPLQAQTQVMLPEATALHVVRVLRLRAGAELTVFDGRGGEYAAEILAITRDEVRIAVGSHRPIDRESPARITLMQSLARGERMDLIVQKATELGVDSIVPVASQHSVVRLEGATAVRRIEHWRQVVISACEQCGRNRIPSIRDVTDVASACAAVPTQVRRYLLNADATESLATILQRDLSGPAPERCELALLIGPEGGWSQGEVEVAERLGFVPVQLGPRVLRTETAPLAALAIVQALCGDLR
jgi:16S rRNA (uracil1498-N3)-methyltransferase